MNKINFYCYAAGKESEAICSDITIEICGVDWQLGDIGHKEFPQKIYNADLVIIVANLNNFSEANNVEFMVKHAENLKVPTLVYSLYPIRLIPQFSEKRTWLAQLDNISKATVLIVLDDDIRVNTINKSTYLTKHYINEGFDYLSTKLIVAIRSSIDPVIRQELIGVDFADYRLVFATKGFYQIKEYSYEALNQAKVNNDNWLKAQVIFVTIHLNNKYAIDVYSSTSSAICNMLEKSDALLLIVPVIEGCVQDEPVIFITYKC